MNCVGARGFKDKRAAMGTLLPNSVEGQHISATATRDLDHALIE